MVYNECNIVYITASIYRYADHAGFLRAVLVFARDNKVVCVHVTILYKYTECWRATSLSSYTPRNRHGWSSSLRNAAEATPS